MLKFIALVQAHPHLPGCRSIARIQLYKALALLLCATTAQQLCQNIYRSALKRGMRICSRKIEQPLYVALFFQLLQQVGQAGFLCCFCTGFGESRGRVLFGESRIILHIV